MIRLRQGKKNRWRTEIRHVKIYKAWNSISQERYERKTVIYIIRKRKEKWKRTNEDAYFISDLPVTKWAKFFAEYIRSHRSIENSLHYVKDVSQNEDASKIRKWNQPQNISIFKNIWLNLFRENWYKNIAKAIRLVSHNIPLLTKLILA